MKNYNIKFKIVFLLILLFTLLGLAKSSLAATCTHYVSNSGSATWALATNINTPTNVQMAFDNAQAGNVVCFRGGTYNVPPKTDGNTYAGYYRPSHSGTSVSWITFQAYTGETPIFNGTAEGGEFWGENGTIGETIFGVYKQKYIIFDGFTFQVDGGTKMTRMTIGSNDDSDLPPYATDYVIVRNCAFNGGSDIHTGTDNAEGLRANRAGHITISNNTFYNYRETNNYHNTSIFKSYAVSNVVIENNVMYNSAAGIYFKSRGDTIVIKYNFIHDVANPILISTSLYYETNGSMYHNIISKFTKAGIEMWGEEDSIVNWNIYNNTVYTNSIVTGNPITIRADYAGTGYQIYNNVLQVQGGADYSGATLRLQGITATTMDYNAQGDDMNVRCDGTPYTTLVSLRGASCIGLTANNHDVHSVSGATVFANGSGNLSLISDFALASNSPGYHAGSDGADIGANISLVGIQSSNPAPDIIPPAIPSGVTVS